MITKSKLILVSFFVLIRVVAAQKPSLTQEAIQSACANDTVVAPDATSVTIKCTGLTPEQLKLLRNIPDLLNKVLKSQQSNTYQILSKLDACVDDSVLARRSAASTIRGVTTVYSYDGSHVRTISHIDGADREENYWAGVPTEFTEMQQLETQHKWADLIALGEKTIKAKSEWITPYLFVAEAYLEMGQTQSAIPLLKHVRDESGGDPQYAAADQWLRQHGQF